MTTLTDFLLARIAEDEADAESIKDFAGAEGYYGTKTLAECEAKRRIVELVGGGPNLHQRRECQDCDVMRALALPYADHPDYREEWKP